MISVTEAESIILSEPLTPGTKEIEIAASAGYVLAEKIFADRDFPPFHRVTMDGIAIPSARFHEGQRNFRIERVVAAGQPANTLADSSCCMEVMTGAILPAGTDTVIRYEDLDIRDGAATITIDQVAAWENVHLRAQDAKSNDMLVQEGLRISAAEVALMASVGKPRVKVYHIPPAAIISTGDELVDIKETPQPWQIRRSNSFALQAALREMNIDSTLYHLPDNSDILKKEIGKIIGRHDWIILSGGVSKGKFDFVPQVLEQSGIIKKFHQVSQKPGKPFWFGRSERHTAFALPGNPVSTFMCFYRYIKPWLEKSLGVTGRTTQATLVSDFVFKPPLTYFLQVRVSYAGGKLMAHPDPGGGSGDFANLKTVDGFLELPAEQSNFRAGEFFPYYAFR